MSDLGSIYAAGRQRLTELVSGLPEERSRAIVPACPEWSVHDVVAHLSGVCDDVLNGNLEGVASDPWTAAQVEKRRPWTLDEVVAEWSEKAPQVEALVPYFPGRVSQQFVLDFTTHEHDVRHALGAPGARASDGVDTGVQFMVEVGFLSGLKVRGLPPLEIVAGDHRWVGGAAGAGAGAGGVAGAGAGVAAGAAADGAGLAEAINQAAGQVLTGEAEPFRSDAEPQGTLKATPFDLMRALTGRRSRDQIKALDWSVDPKPYLPAFQFGPFTTRPDPLDE
jgi:uncharacterized protein (TIGR03083 family)